MEKKPDMTVKEFAEKMDRSYETIIRWLSRGAAPGAYIEKLKPTIRIWRIPESALQMPIPKSGPKAGASKKSAKKKGARAK